MKTCRTCGEVKSLDEFHNRKSSKDGKQSSCKVCNNKNVRRWQASNTDKFEANWRRNSYGDSALAKRRASRYGISLERLNQMLEESKGLCTICGREPINWLVVDHCHATLKVRGVLCERCNQALGLLADNVQFLKNAIQYLERS
jgi:hypothetical protein